MHEIHFAPRKKAWNNEPPVNTNKQWFEPWFQSGAGFRPSTVLMGTGLGFAWGSLRLGKGPMLGGFQVDFGSVLGVGCPNSLRGLLFLGCRTPKKNQSPQKNHAFIAFDKDGEG